MSKMNNAKILDFSPLADISSIPLKNAETVKSWGKTLIIAPHPDDESLGCGGAIALLRNFNVEVGVLVLSDGTLSHPNSVKFPAEKLRDLRESEMIVALKILGVQKENITFFRYKDRSVPDCDSIQSVVKCADYLGLTKPQTILVPWRRDPHPDHRAAFSLINEANKTAKVIEYPIWLWEIAESDDAPTFEEVTAFRLDISSVTLQKQHAINAHQSQTTDLIDDDPHSFRLTPEILANFAENWEIYLQEKI